MSDATSLPLIHYSARPFVGRLAPMAQVDSVDHGTGRLMKPIGFWVSAGDGEDSWREWCESERFRVWWTLHKTEVILKPDAKILRLTTAEEIDAFHKKFSFQMGFEAELEIRFHGHNNGRSMFVRWDEVAKEFDGIVIAPYIWARRLDGVAQWYYSWDCASGCIWNPDAIAEMRPYEGDFLTVLRRALRLLYINRGATRSWLNMRRYRRRTRRGEKPFSFMEPTWPWMVGEAGSFRQAWRDRKKRPPPPPAEMKTIAVKLGTAKFDIAVPAPVAGSMLGLFRALNKVYRGDS